ncbi:MAG: maleylpyruvate isomerase family mycothiol-dependent enzyme, partial [Acidimicrobiales bacterium]
MATWERAGQLRRDMADIVGGLSEEQLQLASLCEQWTVRGVTCHVTAFVTTSFPKFMWTVAKNRGNFDNASLEMANTELARPMGDVLADLRAKATKSSALPMFPEELTMTDTMIHMQDIRRPLGLGSGFDDESMRTALDFLTEHKMATTLVDRKPLEGVKLSPSDLDWSWGDGAEISGSAEAIMMAMANR